MTPDQVFELAPDLWLDLYWSGVSKPLCAVTLQAADGRTITSDLDLADLTRMVDQVVLAKVELAKHGG